MASIDITIEELKKQTGLFAKYWEFYYTKDYVEAYWQAFDNFNIVKAAQDRNDQALLQFKFDLAIAALTICGGSVLAAVMGEMTFKRAAGKVLMSALCKANMHDIFTRAKLASNNKVLEFAVGKAGSELTAIAKTELKNIFMDEDISDAIGQSWIEKPHTRQYIMDKFILKNELQLSTACDTLQKAPISTQKKEALVKAIKQSHFCNPPKDKVIKNIGKIPSSQAAGSDPMSKQ